MTERGAENKRPIIAVGVLVFNNLGEVLLGERYSAFGKGMFAIPGGKLERKETFIDAAIREVDEETGLKNKDIIFGRYISVAYEQVYGLEGLTIGVEAYTEAVPKEIISEEIGSWRWVSLDNLPENLFLPSKRIISNYQRGIVRDMKSGFTLTKPLRD